MRYSFRLVQVVFVCLYCLLLRGAVRKLFGSSYVRAGYNERSSLSIPLESSAGKYISSRTSFTVTLSDVNNVMENKETKDGLENLTSLNRNTDSDPTESARDKCAQFNLKTISPVPQPPPFTALASYPRSGNGYTAILIQLATQFYTSSVYWRNERKKPIAQSFPGLQTNFTEGKGICTKTHKHDEEHIQFFDGGGILLIRDPRKCIVSNFVRVYRDEQNGLEKAMRLIRENDTSWIQKSTQILNGWKSLNMDWLHKGKRVLVVSYEKLCDNTVEELAKIVKFLNQPIRLDQIQCAVTLNPCKCQDWVDFKPYFVESVRKYVAELNETLIRDFSMSLPSYDSKCAITKTL